MVVVVAITNAQQWLTLDSCRTLALRNNKQIEIARKKIDATHYERKAAFSNYLPKLSATGIYLHNNKQTSLLDNAQETTLQNLGAILPGNTEISTLLNTLGTSITNALTLDTRNIYIAALSLAQPLFMGGKIVAYNKIARYAEEISHNTLDITIQETIVAVEQAYWQVVSLSSKLRLADSFVSLIKRLYTDIDKMKRQGVATEADLLSVSVRLNEAEIAKLQAENGVSLARMLLCQICGLPVDSKPILADEEQIEISVNRENIEYEACSALQNRREIKNLELLTSICRQETKIARSEYLPQIALIGNIIVSNPNIVNGFQNKFRGTWNIGVELKIPLWNWGEGYYKVKKTKTEEVIANYTLADVREKIELQVHSSQQQYEEAEKRMILAQSNINKAEENLRNANIAFAEGVSTSEEVLEAQTAWLQAHSAKIDAQIDVILTNLYLQKALGILKP